MDWPKPLGSRLPGLKDKEVGVGKSTMWYEEPGWYAVALSLISLLVSLLVLKRGRRAERTAVEQRLLQRAVEIDEAFSHHRVAMPYEHRTTTAFPSKAVMLLQQINLLREVFEHREVLGQKGLAAYENWANIMVRPWIESDEDLRKTWNVLRESKGRTGVEIQGWPLHVSADFVVWLEQLIPIQDAKAS